MPTVKIYDIVTNDRYEFPVKAHLTGAKAVAKYIGVTEQKVRQYLHRNRFPGEYKAVEVGCRIVSEKTKARKNRIRCKRYYRKRRAALNE